MFKPDEELNKSNEDIVGITAAREDAEVEDDCDDEVDCVKSDCGDGKHVWKWERKKGTYMFFKTFPWPVLCLFVYLALGIIWGAWHPSWIIFLTVPIYESLFYRAASRFPMLVAVGIVYLLIGFATQDWVSFLPLFAIVPVYHIVAYGIEKKTASVKKE